MIKWLKNFFKYKPKFKVDDLITLDVDNESWDMVFVFKIVEIGKYRYRTKYVLPNDLTGSTPSVLTFNFYDTDRLYVKYTGKLDNVNWDLVK